MEKALDYILLDIWGQEVLVIKVVFQEDLHFWDYTWV